MNNSVSLVASLPLGVFQRTHFAGAGIDYAWSRHRSGPHATATRWIGLAFNGGGSYFLGQPITTAGYPFHYGDYIYLHAMVGGMYNPWSNAHISLTAGPVMGLYQGTTDMGYGADLSGSYYFNNRLGVGPALNYRKQSSNTDALWALSLRASYAF